MAGGSNPNPITIVGDHSGETSGVHGVGASDVESVDGAQSKADAAESAAKTYADDNRYTDADAPVQSVNGQTGSVTVDGGIWTEDANSPKTVTNTDQGIDYSLANTYDLVLIFVRMDADGIGRPIEVQVNNDTGNNYDRFRTNGSEDIGFSEIEIREVTDGGVGAVSVVMSGRWGADKWTMGQPTPINSAGYYPQAAQNTSVEGPLDSIQIKTSSTSVAELTMEVYGRNIS